MEFKYIALSICILLVIILLWVEFSRKNRNNLYLRLIATIFLVACLAFLVFPVEYQVSAISAKNTINVLSTGTPQEQPLEPGMAAITTDQQIYQSRKRKKVSYTTDLLAYLSLQPQIKQLNLYGYGLSDYELQQLKNYKLRFHPVPAPKGLLKASWASELKSTEMLNVQGYYQNPADKEVKLLLEGFGSHLDSVVVKAGQSIKFSFSDRPKQTGKAVYQILAMSGKDTLEKEPVPFMVKLADPGLILMLSAAPDFEFKFLKDWLFDHHYPLMLRSRISKDKFSTDFLNTSVINLDRLNAGLLQKTALLVIDEEELSTLSGAEQDAINRASGQGMGVLIRSAAGTQKQIREFSAGTIAEPAMKDQEIVPRIQRNAYQFSALPAGQTQFIKPSAGYTMLVTTKGKGLVNSRMNGAGKIIYTVIPSTFNWMLDGKKADYTAFWSALIATGIRKETRDFNYAFNHAFPIRAEQVQLNVETSSDRKIPQVLFNQQLLSPAQHPQIPFQWSLEIWPDQAGWNTISVNQSEAHFYVYETAQWAAARNLERLNHNKNLLKEELQHAGADELPVFVKQSLSLWWFIAGFLLSAGFLWYESKKQEQNGQ